MFLICFKNSIFRHCCKRNDHKDLKNMVPTMKMKEKLVDLYEAINEKIFSQFGFYLKDASVPKIVDYLHKPTDSSSLAVTRILFGLAMLFDIPDERGGANLDNRWGDPNICHFPLFWFLQPVPMPYMAFIYTALWFGALGIMLGYKYRVSAAVFTVCYWYLFLIEKSYWNNHSYLFGLVALLLTCTEASCYWSIDAHQDPSKLKSTVPYWNYFILKYQFFILYFMAGMKKGTAEWLTGYSVQNLSQHWVFAPFRLFLTVPQTDYLIVHWFVFLFDLTISIWMMHSKTRHVAMVFCAMFHLMNSRLFRIGMFPWVCLATMPLFYPFDWPKILLRKLEFYFIQLKALIRRNTNKALVDKACTITVKENREHCEESINEQEDYIEEDDVFGEMENITETKEETATGQESGDTQIDKCKDNRKRMTLYLIIFYVVTQAFLPYSHFLTKGYNNWTNGLYGYSWDMMVHSWDTHAVIIKVIDNDSRSVFYIDPYLHTPNDRWTRHGDMVYQYARCLKDKIIKSAKNSGHTGRISKNISIYFDVWCSMNGRFTQRLFDCKADMLKVDWSPFKSMTYVMPLLDEALSWRNELDAMRQHVHTWSNNSDVVFLADFPGYEQEKYISSDLKNVTLAILEGEVVYEPRVTDIKNGHSYKLSAKEHISVNIGVFHKVINIGKTPAYYMYTFYNATEENVPRLPAISSKLPVGTELVNRFTKMLTFVKILVNNIVQNVFLSSCG